MNKYPDTLGTEAMPYDPADPVHKAITIAEEIIQSRPTKEDIVAETKTVDQTKDVPTIKMVYEAVRELTTNISELAKQVKELQEDHKKWVKAGKF